MKQSITPRKKLRTCLQTYSQLPEWIESSEFIRQYRNDYPNEDIQLSERLVFDIPQGELGEADTIRILECCRFFGINDWTIFSQIVSYYIKNPLLDGIDVLFPEFDDLWNCINHLLSLD